MQGQRIGYIRVSSFDQNPDRQLEQIDVGKVFTDKGVLSQNRRNFRHPSSSPATSASRSIILPSLWKV